MNILPSIVVLDGHVLNPGDLSWEPLAALGALTVHSRTTSGEIVGRSRGAGLLLTNKVPVNAATMAALPELRYIGVLATGYNVVDTAAAQARGVVVSNIPAYGTASVAQHVFALLLELTHRTGHHAQSVRAGRWSVSPDWCYWDGALVELEGLTLGIVGAGRIGQAVGQLGAAFGMRVIYARHSDGEPSLESVLRTSDVVSLHCPLTVDTKHLINATRLAWMKPASYLINTSRGALVDEVALAAALHAGRLAGAGLDVLTEEPPALGNVLCAAPNCIITPHLAWATLAARERLMRHAVANVQAFLNESPRNVVS